MSKKEVLKDELEDKATDVKVENVVDGEVSKESEVDGEMKGDSEEENEVSEQTEVIEEISEEERLTEELVKEKDKFLRLFAEFENYKRRTSKERIELFKTAGSELMGALLPVLDDFDRGMKEIDKSKDKSLVDGVKLIHNKLKDTLKQKNLEEVTVEQGHTFDSDIHEAITQIPAPTDDLKGKIVDVVEKGYKLGDKIIRFPKVVIGIK